MASLASELTELSLVEDYDAVPTDTGIFRASPEEELKFHPKYWLWILLWAFYNEVFVQLSTLGKRKMWGKPVASFELWRRQWHPTPVLLPGKSHEWRSLVGCSPWGREESDTTERLHFHFSLSCIGEGNGNLLQYSCLENPRDGGAWWAAVYGLAQSQTQLKQLSSSSFELMLISGG